MNKVLRAVGTNFGSSMALWIRRLITMVMIARTMCDISSNNGWNIG